MKIEKLTENKIRIIIEQHEFEGKVFEQKEFIFSTPEFQKLFLHALDKAEKEVDFKVDDSKLLIELFYQSDDAYVFTVTKYVELDTSERIKPKKYKPHKKVKIAYSSSIHIYKFNDFEDFCNFCDYIKSSNTSLKGLFKNSILYFYNNSYFLVIKDFNLFHKYYNLFCACLLEFADILKYTKEFEFKLKEHGRVAVKNNAINIGKKYF